ncbi:Hpt domain-containing protein [Aeromonas cavernicola]|uniref:Hpt domain-containing protein n=1 Tax=Aeromonas cavernicola TaxID=1006623 RepID=A0A2H9U6T0_9GAMM|nr:Hpt domain-containing protein [Aeromonas cavernicola]PJG59757.1 Hpt domain-containing protein [Aeromonas cavernicola]
MEWVDRKVLQQLAEDIGQEMMPVIIAVFIEEVGEQLSQLRPLYEQGEWDALARVAHSMKSSCGSYGAMPSYQQLMGLEAASKQENATEALNQLLLLEQSLPQVLALLADYV